MVFGLIKSIRALPFLSLKRNKAAGAPGLPESAANDSRLPPPTSVLEQVRCCERCGHFAGIFPVRSLEQGDYSGFGGCVRPGDHKIVLSHDQCAFWERSRLKAKRPGP